MHKLIIGLAVLSLTFLAQASSSKPVVNKTQKPNILLIVVDDMGFADLSSFGSEIPTPNLDALANNGVKLSQFITSSVCSPSRASLLTGLSPHNVGFGNLAEERSPNQMEQPGYEGYLTNNAITIAQQLKNNDYSTMMAGKWHVGKTEESSPFNKGFEQTFAMITNASHFADMKPAYSPKQNAKAFYRENGKRINTLPKEYSYSSQFFADRLMSQISSANQEKPFFAMLTYSAPHWPIQAPDEAIKKQKGKYDLGYDVIAKQRLTKQKTLGLIPENAELSPRPPKGQPWNKLNTTEKQTQARAMEVYAAMIVELDKHTGRLIDYLKSENKFDNTVIIFISDNGPEGHDLDETWPQEQFPKIRKVIEESHDFSFDNMGRPNSYTFYGPNWAWASSPSFNGHKAFQTEGGIRTAAFVYAPKLFPQGVVNNEMITISDIPATILEIAKIKPYVNSSFDKMTGESMLSVLQGKTAHLNRVHIEETMGKISVRQGNWKLVKIKSFLEDDHWSLFYLANDLDESNDIAALHPDKEQELIGYWNNYKKENKVILPDWISGY
jgi:arylsulfatase